MSSAPVSRGFLLERLSDAGRQSQPEEVHLIDRHPKPFIICGIQGYSTSRGVGCASRRHEGEKPLVSEVAAPSAAAE
jgi:hypothetical protein